MGGSSRSGAFACPRGCMFTFGGVLRRNTFKSWMKHMQEKHGGATQEELEVVNALLSSEATKPMAQLELEAEPGYVPPEDGATATQRDSGTTPSQDSTASSSERPKRMSAEQKRINAEINEKLQEAQKLIFEGIPRSIFDSLAASHESETFRLTESQSKWIEDSLAVASKGMGLNFEIEPWNFTVKSPLYLLLYPLAVIAFIFMGKKRAVDAERASLAPEPASAPQQVQ